MAARTERKKVAAIDLGTTFSGCAFADLQDILEDPEKITVLDLNGTAPGRLISKKTPSSILFGQDMEFMAFGHDAEEQYAQLQCEGKDWNVYMFKWFKMLLYSEQDLSIRKTKIKDVRKREFVALNVFSECLAFLRKKLLEAITVDDLQIHWVITVPAIWSENAKQFMREAALKAGFDRLSLALEPEAASIFCKHIPRTKLKSGGSLEVSRFSEGDKYIVLDIGGGTTDITVHEILENNTIKELVSANGGDWGGRSIDKEFEILLLYLVGADVMEIIDNNYAEDKFQMNQEFEITKRTVNPTSTGWVKIKLPGAISEQFKDMNNQSLEESINNTEKGQGGKIKINSGNLMINAERFKELFKSTNDHIIERVKCIRMELNDDDLKKILLVGGFGESTLLYDELRKTFPDMTIVVPEDAGLAVLKGAVLFGFNQDLIKARVCRKTYGIQTHKHFEPGMDSPDRRLVIRGKVLCKDSFDIHAQKNDEFEVDAFTQPHEYVPSDPGNNTMSLNVLASDDEWPKYADSPGVVRIGKIIIDLKDIDVNNPKPIEVQMQFGRTELGVVAKEKETGKETKAVFKLLK